MKYRRIVLKLSGEFLGDRLGAGYAPAAVRELARQVAELLHLGVQIALVVGGGNLFRGSVMAEAGMDRATGDQVGMLATVMNALVLSDTLRRAGVDARVLSAIDVGGLAERYVRDRALSLLDDGKLVLFAGGTGNPFFTTDSAACLRALEIGAELVAKATKVDGIYSADPRVHADAVRYERLSYDEFIRQGLDVLDMTAICLCRVRGLPIRVFAYEQENALMQIVQGQSVGTLVTA